MTSSRSCETPFSLDGQMNELEKLIERIRRKLDGIDEALSAIKACPGACRTGTVKIRAGGTPLEYPCPILSSECAFGKRVAAELNSFLCGVMRMIGVPPRHLGNLEDVRDTVAVQASRMWHCRDFLVLSGAPGTGKSFAAAWKVRARLRESVPDWLDRSAWAAASRAGEGIAWASAKEIADDRTLATRCRTVPFLVVDDLGKEEESKTALAALGSVISKRYDLESPTIVTTELAMRDIANRYGRHIAERLAEGSLRGGRFDDCGEKTIRLGGGAI